MEVKDRIIVALDVANLDAAKCLLQDLVPHVGYFKVGLELLTAVGAPAVVDCVHHFGGQVFFDGKFNDIPNTVAGAARAVAKLKVDMFNVHASAGIAAMKAAVKDKGNALVLAVTVLTSLDHDEAYHIFGKSCTPKVMEFVCDATIAGCDGIICSPQELEILKRVPGSSNMLKVTPGVRPLWAKTGDQKRVMTPAEAIQLGADYLVIGRPITDPPEEIGSPIDAAIKIAEEIASVL